MRFLFKALLIILVLVVGGLLIGILQYGLKMGPLGQFIGSMAIVGGIFAVVRYKPSKKDDDTQSDVPDKIKLDK